jgi:hypothetical protein
VLVQRQQVDISQGQAYLFTEYRQRFVITNIPQAQMDASEVFCFAYGRCDQENIIEQLETGIAALRMPTGELLANGAFLMAGQLAWCLRSWLSALPLPKETTRGSRICGPSSTSRKKDARPSVAIRTPSLFWKMLTFPLITCTKWLGPTAPIVSGGMHGTPEKH